MLKEFRVAPDAEHWDKLWTSKDIGTQIQNAKQSPLFDLFVQYLPKKGRILEGGCGNGQWVRLLHDEGYDIVGLDFAKETIAKLRKEFPELNLINGDLTRLEYPDGHFAGHISRGVIEHFEHGPDVINSEITRTLKKSGILIITTPHYNMLKRMKYGLGNKKGHGPFYQYHFTKRELHRFFRREYVLLHVEYFNPFKTLKDELPLKRIRRISQRSPEGTYKTDRKEDEVQRRPQGCAKTVIRHAAVKFERNAVIRRLFGHSVGLVLKKQ